MCFGSEILSLWKSCLPNNPSPSDISVDLFQLLLLFTQWGPSHFQLFILSCVFAGYGMNKHDFFKVDITDCIVFKWIVYCCCKVPELLPRSVYRKVILLLLVLLLQSTLCILSSWVFCVIQFLFCVVFITRSTVTMIPSLFTAAYW